MERVDAFLRQLPVDALWGVGPGHREAPPGRRVVKLVDVRTSDSGVLRRAVGSRIDWLRRLAEGKDDRPVSPHRT